MTQQPTGDAPAEERRKPLDPTAASDLRKQLDWLREEIIRLAEKNSEGDVISPEDVYHAYQHMEEFQSRPKFLRAAADSQAIVSQALRENRICEAISYALAISLFVVGLALLIHSGFIDPAPETQFGGLAAGALLEVLFLVPLRIAVNSRRHNIALRMLGLLIDKVDDPEKLVRLLQDTFAPVIAGNVNLGDGDA